MREVRREGRRRTAARKQRSKAPREQRTQGLDREIRPPTRHSLPRGMGTRRSTWLAWGVLLAILFGVRLMSNVVQPIAATLPGSTASPASAQQGFVLFIMAAAAAYVLITAAVARSAKRKGRSPLAWFFLAWFFPVISWIIVASMAPSAEAIATRGLRDGSTVRCARCREIIRADARVCRYCGHLLG